MNLNIGVNNSDVIQKIDIEMRGQRYENIFESSSIRSKE